MKKTEKNTPKKDGNTFKILGIELIGNTFAEVLGLIEARISQNHKTFITTPNPEFLVYVQDNPWFARLLIQSDIAIPDGVALFWAEEVLLKKGLFPRLFVGFLIGLKVIFSGWGEKRISGTDLTEKLCHLAAQKGWTVYFLGGKPGIAQKTLNLLEKKYPGLKGWAAAGPNLELIMDNGEWKTEQKEINRCVDEINKEKPDFLFVALGMGKQEKFIGENWGQLKVKLGIGIGGAFDYLSGEVRRAPQWIQKTGFEWLYRLCQEPWRWKRQLKLWQFIWLILTEKS